MARMQRLLLTAVALAFGVGCAAEEADTGTASPAAATTTSQASERDPSATSEPTNAAAAACDPGTPAKSDQRVEMRFVEPGESVCIWWEPAANAESYRVEVEFPAGGDSVSREVDGGTTSFLLDLGSVSVPGGQDRDRALKGIDVRVWAIQADGREALVGGAALVAK